MVRGSEACTPWSSSRRPVAAKCMVGRPCTDTSVPQDEALQGKSKSGTMSKGEQSETGRPHSSLGPSGHLGRVRGRAENGLCAGCR